jgi:DNA-binding MarR family transcriptional regulator
MSTGDMPGGHAPGLGQLGAALRRALAGYRRQLDDDLAAAGFPDRRFPEGRVLVMCGGPEDITISEIGRRLDITRQGASKIVAGLRERGYVAVTPSPADGREKLVTLTPRSAEMLAVRARSAERLEARLRAEIGPEALAQVFRALDLIAARADPPPGLAPALRRLRWRDAEDEM